MNKHVAVIQLAKEGVEIHGKTDPEYIVCAEVLRLNEVNQELLEALKEIIPKNLNLVNIFIPDKAVIQMDFTMGEFRKIATAIAKAERSTQSNQEDQL